jgi:hypothetical protein
MFLSLGNNSIMLFIAGAWKPAHTGIAIIIFSFGEKSVLKDSAKEVDLSPP